MMMPPPYPGYPHPGYDYGNTPGYYPRGPMRPMPQAVRRDDETEIFSSDALQAHDLRIVNLFATTNKRLREDERAEEKARKENERNAADSNWSSWPTGMIATSAATDSIGELNPYIITQQATSPPERKNTLLSKFDKYFERLCPSLYASAPEVKKIHYLENLTMTRLAGAYIIEAYADKSNRTWNADAVTWFQKVTALSVAIEVGVPVYRAVLATNAKIATLSGLPSNYSPTDLVDYYNRLRDTVRIYVLENNNKSEAKLEADGVAVANKLAKSSAQPAIKGAKDASNAANAAALSSNDQFFPHDQQRSGVR